MAGCLSACHLLQQTIVKKPTLFMYLHCCYNFFCRNLLFFRWFELYFKFWIFEYENKSWADYDIIFEYLLPYVTISKYQYIWSRTSKRFLFYVLVVSYIVHDIMQKHTYHLSIRSGELFANLYAWIILNFS